jgi:hypothetical protein
MEASPARRIVLLLDCCFSGAFTKGMRTCAGGQVDVLERFTGRGRAVITATNAMEYAFEIELCHFLGARQVGSEAELQHGPSQRPPLPYRQAMGLRVEHLDTDVIRSCIQVLLHTLGHGFSVAPCDERVY